MHVIQVEYKWLGEHSNMVNYKNINNNKKKKVSAQNIFQDHDEWKKP